eukprot:gene11087-11242_t
MARVAEKEVLIELQQALESEAVQDAVWHRGAEGVAAAFREVAEVAAGRGQHNSCCHHGTCDHSSHKHGHEEQEDFGGKDEGAGQTNKQLKVSSRRRRNMKQQGGDRHEEGQPLYTIDFEFLEFSKKNSSSDIHERAALYKLYLQDSEILKNYSHDMQLVSVAPFNVHHAECGVVRAVSRKRRTVHFCPE